MQDIISALRAVKGTDKVSGIPLRKVQETHGFKLPDGYHWPGAYGVSGYENRMRQFNYLLTHFDKQFTPVRFRCIGLRDRATSYSAGRKQLGGKHYYTLTTAPNAFYIVHSTEVALYGVQARYEYPGVSGAYYGTEASHVSIDIEARTFRDVVRLLEPDERVDVTLTPLRITLRQKGWSVTLLRHIKELGQ